MQNILFITTVILLMLLLFRFIKRKTANDFSPCPRCKGIGEYKLGEELVDCRRCGGTGQIVLGYKNRR